MEYPSNSNDDQGQKRKSSIGTVSASDLPKRRRRSSLISQQSIENENHIFPIEVWSGIFEFLPLMDRKLGRLVCRRWNEILAQRSFLLREKLVVSESVEDKELKTLRYCWRNYEFVNRQIRCSTIFNSFWKNEGMNISELEFTDKCSITHEMFHRIVIGCTTLKYLQLDLTFSATSRLLKALEKLNVQEIQRPTLKSLNVKSADARWVSYALLVFPNIENVFFSLRDHTNKKEFYQSLEPFSSNPGNKDSVIRSKRSNFISMLPDKFFQSCHSNLYGVTLDSSVKFTNFQEILIDGYQQTSFHVLNWFLQHQTLLRKLEISDVEYFSDWKIAPAQRHEVRENNMIDSVMDTLLENCKNLKYFKISMRRLFVEDSYVECLSPRVYEKLVHSKLEHLEVVCGTFILLHEYSSWTLSEVKNETLRYLSIRALMCRKNQLTIIQTFKNLDHLGLQIQNWSSKILSQLPVHQKKLRSLTLFYSDFSMEDFVDVEDSIDTIRGWTILDEVIHMFKEDMKTSCVLNQEFSHIYELSNLTSLCTDTMVGVLDTHFISTSNVFCNWIKSINVFNLSHLCYLHFSVFFGDDSKKDFRKYFEKLVESLAKSTNLSFLSLRIVKKTFHGIDVVQQQKLENILSACSNLKFLNIHYLHDNIPILVVNGQDDMIPQYVANNLFALNSNLMFLKVCADTCPPPNYKDFTRHGKSSQFLRECGVIKHIISETDFNRKSSSYISRYLHGHIGSEQFKKCLFGYV